MFITSLTYDVYSMIIAMSITRQTKLHSSRASPCGTQRYVSSHIHCVNIYNCYWYHIFYYMMFIYYYFYCIMFIFIISIIIIFIINILLRQDPICLDSQRASGQAKMTMTMTTITMMTMMMMMKKKMILIFS